MPRNSSQKPTETLADDGQTPAFTRERLVRDAQPMLGHPRYVVAGALVNLNPNTYLTVAEAKQRVRDFIKTEVQGTGDSTTED